VNDIEAPGGCEGSAEAAPLPPPADRGGIARTPQVVDVGAFQNVRRLIRKVLQDEDVHLVPACEAFGEP
jgi:hypothetical protein